MTFDWRGITEKERSEYDLDAIAVQGRGPLCQSPLGSWIIDEDRNAFLIQIAHSPRWESDWNEYAFAFCLRGRVRYFGGEMIVLRDPSANTRVTWRGMMLAFFEETEEEKSEIRKLIREALLVFGEGSPSFSHTRSVEIPGLEDNLVDAWGKID